MDLREIITVIEDLFYNFVAWIALYPKTMLWGFFRPGRVQQYITDEWQKPQSERFRLYVNPFIFWLLSMVLFIWSLSGGETEASISFTLEAFTLLMVLFATLPVIFSALMLSARRIPLSSDELRRPLYTQMIIFGVAQTLMALELSISTPLTQMVDKYSNFLSTLLVLIALLLWIVVLAVIFLWLPIAQIRIFMKELSRPWTRVIGWVLLGLFLCGIIILLMPLISSEIDLVLGTIQFRG